jgi:hypothetical protein
MEPEGSLPPSQEPSTGPYPEPDRSNPHHSILSSWPIANVYYLDSGVSWKAELSNLSESPIFIEPER